MFYIVNMFFMYSNKYMQLNHKKHNNQTSQKSIFLDSTNLFLFVIFY